MKQSRGTDVSVSISAMTFTNNNKTVDCINKNPTRCNRE